MRRLLPKIQPDNYHSRLDDGVTSIIVQSKGVIEAQRAAHLVATFAETTFGEGPSEYRDNLAAWRIAQDAAAFKGVVPTSLEAVPISFYIDGVSRATTHQLVRTRVGAGFGQFSQRANPMTAFNVRLPRSFAHLLDDDVYDSYVKSLPHLRRFHEALLEAGVPYQDARYVLPEGVETSITATYNLLSLMGTIRRRVCNRMQWEINYLARVMADLTVAAYPWVGRALRSGCEGSGTCQTIDPMFPPSCLAADGSWAKDHRVLLSRGEDEYNFPLEANGTYIHFADLDTQRIQEERKYPGIVMSMAKPGVVLARINGHGLWEGVN